MVRKKDRFWEYAEDLNGRFKCKFCERDFAGGASRIKCHLAGVKGHDIDICTKVSKEVQEEASLIVGQPKKKNLRVHQLQTEIKRRKSTQLQYQRMSH